MRKTEFKALLGALVMQAIDFACEDQSNLPEGIEPDISMAELIEVFDEESASLANIWRDAQETE